MAELTHPAARRSRAAAIRATLHRWAETGWAGPAVMTWGFLQGSFVPGSAEMVLVPLGLAGPRRALPLAAWMTAGSVLGGAAAYLVGAFAFAQIALPLLSWFGIDQSELARVQTLLADHGWKTIAIAALTPFPSKLVAVAAGVLGMPFSQFILGLAVGRGVRFGVVGLVIRVLGERIARRWGIATGA